MADVTNDKKQVATTTSQLSAQTTGETCENWNPPKKATKGFFNEAPLPTATEHTTGKTQFGDGRVIRLGEAIGPPSKPAHGWSGGGITSNTYIMEARATKASINLKVEGGPPARDTDHTTQNHGNVPGLIVDPAKAAELAKLAEEIKKRCFIEKLIVGECDHGRTGLDTRMIEVVASGEAPEKVKLEAVRKNTVQPGAAECILGEGVHTKWIITRKLGGGLLPRTEEKHGDKLTLQNDWFCRVTIVPDLQASDPDEAVKQQHYKDKGLNKDGQSQAATKDQIQTRSQEIRGIDNTGTVQNTSGITGGQARAQARAEDQARLDREKAQLAKKNKAAIVTQAINQGINLAKFLQIWFYRKDPVRVTVQGIACSGSQNLEILAFPAEQATFGLGQAEYELMQAVFQKIKAFADFFVNLGKTTGGVGFAFELKFMEDPEVSINCQWKELTKDASKEVGLKKYQCNKDVTGKLGIKTIAGVLFEFYVSAAVFFNALIPGSGVIVQYIIDWAGIEAKVGVKVEFSIGATLECGWDEYEVYKKLELKPAILIKVSFFVRLRYRDKFTAEGAVVLKGEPEFHKLEKDKDAVFKFNLKAGAIKIGFSGTFYVSVLWWEKNETGEWWPSSWKYEYGETELRPLRPIMALLK